MFGYPVCFQEYTVNTNLQRHVLKVRWFYLSHSGVNFENTIPIPIHELIQFSIQFLALYVKEQKSKLDFCIFYRFFLSPKNNSLKIVVTVIDEFHAGAHDLGIAIMRMYKIRSIFWRRLIGPMVLAIY